MKLSQEFKIASEFREKVHLAEDQLRNEKKNLYKAQTMMMEEKEKWLMEESEKKEKISQTDRELKEKEVQYEEVKGKCMETMQRIVMLESENDALKKEIQKIKLQKEDDMCKYMLEQGNLEVELTKIRDWKSDLKVSHKLKKSLQLGAPGEKTGSERKEQNNEDLTDGEKPTGKTSERKMKELLNNLAEITAECEQMESKNQDIEEELAFMDKLQ